MVERLAALFGDKFKEAATVGDDVEGTFGPLDYVTQAFFEVCQQVFFADYLVTDKREPDQMCAAHASDEETVFPDREECAGVEGHAAGGNYRVPVIDGLLHALPGLDSSRDGAPCVFDSVGDSGPAVVFAFAGYVEFVAATGAVFDGPEFACGRVEGGALDVGMADGPNLGPGSRFADEGVVFGDGAIGVDADDFAEETVEALGLHAAFGDGAVARCNEKSAVATEDQAAAEVQRGLERGSLLEDDLDVFDFGSGALDQFATGYGGVVGAVVVALGVAPVDELVLGKLGVEGEAEETALAACVDSGEAGDRFRNLAVRGQDAEAAGFLCDEDIAGRKEGDAPRLFEGIGDGDNFKGDV